jgi:predicted amidohydrolase
MQCPAAGEGRDQKKRGEVKIAVIGHRAPAVGANTKPEQIVDRMIGFWKGRFANVLPDKPDLIVVPEACDRPRGLSREKVMAYYRVRGNRVRDYFAQVARENSCYVVYSAIREMDDKTWRNSSCMIDRKGKVIGIYDKNHPTIGEVDQKILCGTKAPVIECDFGRVAFAICFDLNFDRLRKRYVESRPDLIVFSSMYHGGLMQAYWAYSCRCYFVGAIERSCPSQIRSPLGEVVATTTNYQDYAVATVNLDCELAHLDYNRGRFTQLKKKYGPAVDIRDPGRLGSVLITSKHEELGVKKMIEEFEVELLDDYMKRALEYHDRPGHVGKD